MEVVGSKTRLECTVKTAIKGAISVGGESKQLTVIHTFVFL